MEACPFCQGTVESMEDCCQQCGRQLTAPHPVGQRADSLPGEIVLVSADPAADQPLEQVVSPPLAVGGAQAGASIPVGRPPAFQRKLSRRRVVVGLIGVAAGAGVIGLGVTSWARLLSTARSLLSAGGHTEVTYHGHTDIVSTLSWSPDGQYIVSGSLFKDHTVQVWDAFTGDTRLTLQPHLSAVWMVAWSPNGTWIATADNYIETTQSFDPGAVHIWDPHTGTIHLTYTRGPVAAAATIVAWSSDSTRLVLDAGEQVQVVNASTGQVLLEKPQSLVTALAWSPDGTRIASARNFPLRAIEVWNATSGVTQLVYGSHADADGDWDEKLAWSPDGTRIVSATTDGQVQVWNATSGERLLLYQIHSGDVVLSLAWSPNGKQIATVSTDGQAHIWNAATGRDESLYTSGSGFVSAYWSPDGKRLASACHDHSVVVWQPE